jgi:hypothetical protein
MSERDGPSILRPLATEEYVAPARTEEQQRAAALANEQGTDAAARTGVPIRRYWASRRGTAAGLLALNDAAGDRYYEVPEPAASDDEAAEEAFRSDGPVIDVQTHWIENKPGLADFQKYLLKMYRHQAPDWWAGLDGMTAYNLAEYLRCIFVESETAVAVLSSTPGNSDGDMFITNAEMVGIRELFDRMAGTGRLLSHTVVRPNVGDIELMPAWAETFEPSAWKVYTLGVMEASRLGYGPRSEWRLDDERTGLPFLEQARATGVRRVCAHKGISGMVASGAPDDVGPAAVAFPDIDFLIYHSGYEPGGPSEAAYSADGPGVDRLIASVEAAGLGPGGNVYAELGTTWFNLVSKPTEAAHVLGKLLLHLGEDNIMWGTDAIWYGPTQPVLDAFRTFQIPDALCEEFGYPKLTAEIRRKIVAGNASRVYGIDLDSLTGPLETEDVRQWSAAVLEEHGRFGLVR